MRRMGVLALVMVLMGTACMPPLGGGGGGGGGAAAGPLGSGNGFADRGDWRERQDGYLHFATETVNRSSVPNVLAHLARSSRDSGYDFDAGSVEVADLQAVFDKIDGHIDTSDFDMMRLMALHQGHADELDADLRAAVEDRFTGFRYWYTDPLPEGIVDDKWFWSENHRIIVHALEYLAGRALPGTTFDMTGEPGTVHEQRGRERIEEWLDEKADFGFSEWHSDVYYAKDIEPLLLLTEYAEPDLARRAAAMLDMVLFDVAVHQLSGNMGVTHGRSYMKDKSRAADQDVFNATKLAFDTTEQPYTSRGDATAVALARADRYRPPAALERVARSTEPFVDRQRMGAEMDLDQPLTSDPVAPEGTPSFTDPEGIPFWWERGAHTAWPVVPLTLQTIEQYDLWETSLFQPFKPLADIAGGDMDVARQLAYSLKCMINVGLLSEVDTITWRSAHAMLSTAQDHRAGCHGNQYHAWQATLDEDAVVFTTHPGNEPRPGDRWVDADMYWTGTSTMPCSAQHGTAAINMYAPQYASPEGPPLDAFAYLDYTHAYFPTEHFDEVREVDGWTFGRSGDGYVALWSWRPTEWRSHDPGVTFTNGLTEPFDLVAPGGADNVWITEVGDVDRWGSFDEFVAGISGAAVDVVDLGTDGEGFSRGFDVRYESPTEDALELSWTGPFTVGGTEVPLHHDLRIDNPFSTVEWGADQIHIEAGGASVDLDLATGRRHAKLGGR